MKKFLLSLVALVIGAFAANAATVDLAFTNEAWTAKWTANGTYGKHLIKTDAYTVELSSASNQSGTITDVPVMKAGDVIFTIAGEGTIKKFTLNCKEWSSKKKPSATLSYSTDGTNYTKVDGEALNNYVINADSFTNGVKSVKVTFTKTEQIGLVSIEYELNSSLKPSGLKFAESAYTANLGEAFDSPELTNPDNLTVKWDSSVKTVATVDPNGKVTIVGAGNTTISAKPTDDTYEGASYLLSVSDPNSKYVLVTEVAQLGESAQIIIVNTANSKALSTTQNGNNRGEADITFADDGSISNYGNAQIITLTNKDDKYSLGIVENNQDGTEKVLYLYAAGTSKGKNYLRTGDDEKLATITIGEKANADITFVGLADGISNKLKYNSQGNIFSCYASGQSDVQIYMLQKAPVTPPAEDLEIKINNEQGTLNCEWEKGDIILKGDFFKNGADDLVEITIEPENIENFKTPDADYISNLTVEEKNRLKGHDSWLYTEEHFGENHKAEAIAVDGSIMLDIPCSGKWKVTIASIKDPEQNASAVIEIKPTFKNISFTGLNSIDHDQAVIDFNEGENGDYKHTAYFGGWYEKVSYKFISADQGTSTASYAPSKIENTSDWTALDGNEFELDPKASGSIQFMLEKNGVSNESKPYAMSFTSTGVEEIFAEEGVVEFYTLNGMRVYGDLQPGLYIVRKGGKSAKILVK